MTALKHDTSPSLAPLLNMGVIGITLAALMALVMIGGVEANPLLRPNVYSGPPMNKVDMCILACDACYRGESLLVCANTCIKEKAKMNYEWDATCPFFHLTKK
ncbi:hypothetical protein Hamer_G024588 [Homarus americanus]|uniref:Uncharacterized protein n=1 Tax=Homarus americanus TaxID=6706 RepID=A0A8J5JAQ1_HOMAM|nr:hypothetical protein Hamer_G024588 [Homarus americanus]